MYTIIPLLLAHIQELNKQILFLFKFIVKNIPLNLEKSKDDSLFSPKYNKLKVDKLPIIHVPEKKDYKQLLEQHIKEHGKPLKPIKSRGKNPVPDDVHCPCKNDKIRMYEKSKITMYKHTFFFVYFFRRYTKNGKINYTIKDIERNEFKTKLFSFS